MEVGDRGTEGIRVWPRACGASPEKPLGYQGCCDGPDGRTSDSAAVNESIGEGPTEITNPRAAPCRAAHRPGKASGSDVPRQDWTGSAPQRALVPNEEPPGARARALGIRAGLEVSARGYAAEGPFKCRRSRVIKKPAPGLLFNHLPLKRLPAGSPPLGALGNSGGRRGWLVDWKRRADPGRELRCAALRVPGAGCSGAGSCPAVERQKGGPGARAATHLAGRRRSPKCRWRFGSSLPSSSRPACSRRRGRACREDPQSLSVPARGPRNGEGGVGGDSGRRVAGVLYSGLRPPTARLLPLPPPLTPRPGFPVRVQLRPAACRCAPRGRPRAQVALGVNRG